MKQTPNAERRTPNAECRGLGLKFDVRGSVFDVRCFLSRCDRSQRDTSIKCGL